MLVLIESPYAGDVAKNLVYARLCMADCLRRGEFPFASHLLYTQDGILDDNVPAERQLGIDAGLAWGAKAEKTVVYTDLGTSRGMEYGIGNALAAGRPIEYRTLPDWNLSENQSDADLCKVCRRRPAAPSFDHCGAPGCIPF